ncbi:MAG: outer membrane beta-barrel protein [Crocinitomicaceae bacterium]|nr:outer membrane beta-barrel protein [Crocinitomicaceae bacterium]
MKKLLSLALISGVSFGSIAQDKKFQIGLVTGTTINWTKVQTTKIEKNGFGNDFIIGIGGNYMFNENVGLAMGLQFDMGNFTLNYGSDASTDLGDVYYAYEDTDILQYKSDDGGVQDLAAGDTTALAFQLLERTYKTKYITIPVFLKFQTGMLGKFRYYGKFGARMSILGSVRMDDFGRESTYWVTSQSFTTNAPTVEKTMADMKPVGLKKELSPFKMGIGVYGGAEWNFTGNTFLYMEAGFNYGVIPQLYPQSGNMADKVETSAGSGTFTYSNLDIKNNPQHMVEVKLGLLF